MTADEPMSTPDSGGLREAVEDWMRGHPGSDVIHEVTAMVRNGQAVLICTCDVANCPALTAAHDDLVERGLVRLDLANRDDYRDDWPGSE